MNEQKNGVGDGILKGLKRLLFTSDPIEETAQPAKTFPEKEPAKAPPGSAPQTLSPDMQAPAASDNEMKLRVYQLLENMNKPGCDFFEVWNAAMEMGGANSANIKAAYTSLRFADKTLTRDKLLETGNYYISSLKQVLEAETQKRLHEKMQIDQERDQFRTSLDAEIASLEQQLLTIQEKLATKKQDRDTINQKYEPRITAINAKINGGQQSVNSVLSEMSGVLAVIEKDIN